MVNVLVVLNRYLPGYKSGGPVRSIAQIVEQLGAEMAFSVLTTDRDNGDHAPYANAVPGAWVQNGRAAVRYLTPQECRHGVMTGAMTGVMTGAMSEAIRSRAHDVLYLNSFFSPRYSISPMIARRLGHIPSPPVIIAPRGEFSPGALALKGAKKAAFLRFARSSGCWRNVIWQASTQGEARDIRAAMGRQAQHVEVACDLSPALPSQIPEAVARAAGAPLRVLFLSRLTPKKNLRFALEVLQGVTARVQFSVVGPHEDMKYVAQCQRLAARLPQNISVEWVGAVQPDRLAGVFAMHDLMFLPTWGENFGHVIAEAFAAGLPVLVSDRTPWRGLAARGIGYDLPLSDMHAFRAAIETEAARSPEAALAMRSEVFGFARARAAQSTDLDANRALFEAARLSARRG